MELFRFPRIRFAHLPTPLEEMPALRLAAQSEGILLDPVFTGKATAGLLDMLRTGPLRDG